MYTLRTICYSLPFYAKMHWMTFDLVQGHREVKSNLTAPEVDGMDQWSIIAMVSFINIQSPLGQIFKF